MEQVFDTSALRAPVTSEDRRRHGHPITAGSMLAAVGIPAAVLGAFLTVQLVTSDRLGAGGLGPQSLFLVFMVIALIAAPISVVRRKNRHTRLAKFAAANAMEYRASEPASRMLGVLFGAGRNRRNTHVFVTREGVRIGNWTYETGSRSGKRNDKQTHRWRYIEIPLGRRVPNLVLDAKANNGLFGSNLPVSLSRSQRIDLEGDFPDAFTLYAPHGYDFDVRLLLPPDLMAALMDRLADYDLEFIDDRLIVVAKGHWQHRDPSTWQLLQQLVGEIMPRVRRSTDRYVDERVAHASTAAGGQGHAAPQVGRQGRRLRRSGAPAAIGVLVIVAVVGVLVLSRLLL